MVNRVRWELIEGAALLFALFLAIAAGLLWLGIKKLIPFHFAIHLLLAAALADLAFCSMQIVSPPPSSLRSASLVNRESFRPALQPDEVTSWLARQEKPMRIYPAGPLFSENKFAISGIESVGGYHPAKLARYEQFLAGTRNLASLGVLKCLNVGFVLTAAPVEHPSLTLVKTGDLQRIGGLRKHGFTGLKGQCRECGRLDGPWVLLMTGSSSGCWKVRVGRRAFGRARQSSWMNRPLLPEKHFLPPSS